MITNLSIARRFMAATALAVAASSVAVANDTPASPIEKKEVPAFAKHKAKEKAHKPLPKIDFEAVFNDKQFKAMEEYILAESVRLELSSEKLRTAAKEFATKFVQYMVDEGKPYTPEQLRHIAIQGMFDSLSPHDSFIPPSKSKEFTEQMRNEGFVGLGIQIEKHENRVRVIDAIEDSPAEKAGLKGGDYVIEVDGHKLDGLELEEAMKHMRGAPDSRAAIKVLRDGATLDFTVTRAKIQKQIVKYRMLDGGVAHIKVSGFTPNVNLELKHAIAQAKADGLANPAQKAKGGLKGIVIDLMFDGGGLLPEARAISDDFINSTGVVVSTQGRNEEYSERLTASPGKIVPDDMPVVVLINKGSASASEIVAGALQDHRGALIMGADSFGKGTMQTVGPQQDGSVTKTTVGIFRRPSGVSNQWVGVKPTIAVEPLDTNYEKYMKDMPSERDLPHSIPNSHGLESQKNVTTQVCKPNRTGIKLSDAPADKNIFVQKNDYEARYVEVEGSEKPARILPFELGALNPFVECARHYILKQTDTNYRSPYSTIAPKAPALTN